MKRKPFHHRKQLRFACTGCGACCTGTAEDYVAVDLSEQEKIRRHLGVSQRWFRRRYLVRVDDHTEGLASRADGSCIFLDDAMRCRVYPVRPRQCRTYPFWPEIVRSERSWRREGRRCEGIDRGAAIPLKRIEAALRALRR